MPEVWKVVYPQCKEPVAIQVDTEHIARLRNENSTDYIKAMELYGTTCLKFNARLSDVAIYMYVL